MTTGKSQSETQLHKEMDKELIVLAAPRFDDAYYADVYDQIVAFQIGYAQQIAQHDLVLVLTDKAGYPHYASALGSARVVVAPMRDIWIRDFSLSNAAAPVKFRYTAAGQGSGVHGQREADFVQRTFNQLLADARITQASTELLNDGGNFVDDYAGNVVMSNKFLRDNNLSEAQARGDIRALTGARQVAFIEADEQGGLEHADGVVAFVDQNTVIVNAYPDDPNYATQLHADLRAGLPQVAIHEIVAPWFGDNTYDKRFGSACGLYTNALVTPHRIYFPQFGIPEDKIALQQIRAITDKQVIPVDSAKVCHMGGGVRCLSWQLRGPLAEKLLQHMRSLH